MKALQILNTTTEQIENARKWIAALRSGDYAQTRETLRRGFDIIDGVPKRCAWCCLGVACEILHVPTEQRIEGLRSPQMVTLFKFPGPDDPDELVDQSGMPDYRWMLAQYGMPSEITWFLSALNDYADYSFKNVADLLESLYGLVKQDTWLVMTLDNALLKAAAGVDHLQYIRTYQREEMRSTLVSKLADAGMSYGDRLRDSANDG